MTHRARTALALAALLAALASGACGGGAAAPAPPSTPGWWRDKVFYEVFVRSFADSNGDGVGDLAGLTSRLDDLNDGDPATTSDLGIDALWLMPIFNSPSYHGYDVTDYRAIKAQYGTLDDFKALVAAAHQRGIKIILDMVLNHTSSSHPWFQDSQSSPGAARRDWYVWRADDPGWLSPFSGAPVWHASGSAWYYGIFWSGMPDLNLGNPAVENELVATMKFWLGLGVDGFRLDAVRYFLENSSGGLQDLPESHAFLRRVRAALQAEYPNVLLVAEAWAPTTTVATYYGAGDEAHLAFGFDQAAALVEAGLTANAGNLGAALSALVQALQGKDLSFTAPFLTNHDQVRAMRAMGGDPVAARVAAATLLALPGTPFLYYGEEIGMQGGAGTADEEKRTPMRWNATAPGYGFTSAAASWTVSSEAAGVDVATQRADPGSLWNLYRKLLAQRRGQPPLARGGLSFPSVSGGGAGTLALLRTDGSAHVLFVANFGTAPSGPFTVAVGGTPTVLSSEGLSVPPAATTGAVSFSGLGARAFAYVSLN
jgi:alpha-amylase